MLEQLCIGLARVIVSTTSARIANNEYLTKMQCKLGPGRLGPEHELRPEQLAAFYRSLGGNLDSLFHSRTDSGLSFLYRTLGCFHSLEPTLDPFKTPSVACLTPAGFARWQTMMLLLCPEEHAYYMQQAVSIYDVPLPSGGTFPKSIPRESFPVKPDPEMEGWYSHVLQQLKNQQMRRLKNSPHASPNPVAFDGRDGYFGQIPRVRRPSRTSRERSSEGEPSRPGSQSRRKSEPHIMSPGSSSSATRLPSAYHRDGKMRSPSLTRDTPMSRIRSATLGTQSEIQRPVNGSSHRRNGSNPQARPAGHHLERPYPSGPRQGRSSRPISRDDSADEASSEDSASQRKGRSRNASPRPSSKQKNSFFSSFSNPFSSNKRRHSHDATPQNEDDSRKRHEDMPRSARISPVGSSTRRTQHVQFRNDVPPSHRPARESSNPRLQGSNRPSRVYAAPVSGAESDQYVGYPLTREQSSGSGTDPRSGYDSQTRNRRKDSIPLRVSTVSGVGGRRYPSAEPQSASTPPSTNTLQQDLRARYSTAV